MMMMNRSSTRHRGSRLRSNDVIKIRCNRKVSPSQNVFAMKKAPFIHSTSAIYHNIFSLNRKPIRKKNDNLLVVQNAHPYIYSWWKDKKYEDYVRFIIILRDLLKNYPNPFCSRGTKGCDRILFNDDWRFVSLAFVFLSFSLPTNEHEEKKTYLEKVRKWNKHFLSGSRWFLW